MTNGCGPPLALVAVDTDRFRKYGSRGRRSSQVATAGKSSATAPNDAVPSIGPPSAAGSADTADNAVMGAALDDTKAAVSQGEPLSKPLESHPVFPGMVVQMLAVGEETGALDELLDKIADYYDMEVTATVDALTSLIEPLLIVGMGLSVGGMVIALYLPMFNIVNLLE